MVIKTNLHAGKCNGAWSLGSINSVDGTGDQVRIMGYDDGALWDASLRSYTNVYPAGKQVQPGQTALYTLFPAGEANAGKISCLIPN